MNWILTIDVGNTNIVTGCFPDDQANTNPEKPAAFFRLETKRRWQPDELCREFSAFLEENDIPRSEVTGSILSSVVPELNRPLSAAIAQLTDRRPMIMNPSLDTGIQADRYDLSLIGTDRLVDMAAAVHLCRAPVAVWDLGTATTLSVVNKDNIFVGGMISPGVQLGLDALAKQTAQLPQLNASALSASDISAQSGSIGSNLQTHTNMLHPDSLLGLDTRSNMLSGSIAATGIMIDGIASRLKRRSDLTGLHIVITGGLGRLVIPWIEQKVIYDPDLLLKGLNIIYHRNI